MRTPPLPSGLAVSPEGRSLYVATLSARLAQFDIGPRDGRLKPKNEPTVPTGLGGVGASGVAVTPDGRYVYTPNSGAGTVSQFRVDDVTGALIALKPAVVRVGERPEGVAMAPNGRSLYSTLAGADAIRWLSIGRDGRLGGMNRDPIASSPGPHGLLVNPDQGPVARFRVLGTRKAMRPHRRVLFSARSSRDPDGSVKRYRWRFGDGTSKSVSRPVVAHRFKRPGRHVVRLVVNDNENCSARRIYTGQSALCNGGRQAIAKLRFTVRP